MKPTGSPERPTVSVGLLTFNRAEYLREAIAAILAQSFEDFELIVFDNASTDATPDVVAGFSDPRMRYVRHGENIGPHRNYLAAVDECRGRYIAITSDDDLLEPSMLRRQIDAFEANPEVGLVATNVSLIDETGRRIQDRLLQLDQDLRFPRATYVHRYLRDQLWIPTPTWVYRVDALPRRKLVGSKSAGPLGDVYLLCWLNLDVEMLLLADPLVRYRQHEGQYQRQVNSTEAGVQFYRALRDLCRSETELRPILRRVEARLLSYEAELAVTTSPGARETEADRSSAIARIDRRWRRNVPTGQRDIDEILRFEILKALHALSPSIPTERDGGADVNGLYERWLSVVSDGGRGITAGLVAAGVRSVAILGSYLTGYLLALDAMRCGIDVRCFLDSNTARRGEVIAGRTVESPEWLRGSGDVDAVLISSEKDGEQAITAMLESHMGEPVPVVSWKQLAAGSAAQTA